MNLQGTFKIHTLDKLLPKEMPKDIKNMDDFFTRYGKRFSKEFPANSLVGNFVPVILDGLGGNAYSIANVKDTSNTNRTVSSTNGIGTNTTQAAGNEITYGIVFGTGTTAVAITDYRVEAPIGHGYGSGQLYYNLMAPSMHYPVQVDSNNAWFSILRPMSNFSGANITVTECGLIIKSSAYFFLLERTVLSPSYTFTNQQSIIVEYMLKVTV